MELATLNLDFAVVAACHEITMRQEPGYLGKFLAHRIWHNWVFDGQWINLCKVGFLAANHSARTVHVVFGDWTQVYGGFITETGL